MNITRYSRQKINNILNIFFTQWGIVSRWNKRLGNVKQTPSDMTIRNVSYYIKIILVTALSIGRICLTLGFMIGRSRFCLSPFINADPI